MKLTFGFCILLCSSLPGQVPVEQEPDHHAGFHNDKLYMLEPQIPAGRQTLEHVHRYDAITVCIQGSAMRAKPAGGEWAAPGEVCVPGRINATENTGRPRAHTVENTGKQTYHLTLVENLREGGWSEFPALTAAGLKVTKESRSFRSYQVDLKAIVPHTHPTPTMVVLVSGQAKSGKETLNRAGAYAYVPAGQAHSVSGTGQVVEIEVR